MIPGDFSPLVALFSQMDAAYNRIAAQYGFQCNGCKDNCCRSVFFHHTFVEKAFLLYGFSQMDLKRQKEMRQKGGTYISRTFLGSPTQTIPARKSLKLMCPLNQDGRCTLYFFRPMICRLHGLPHQLTRPADKTVVRGPGCTAGKFDDKPYIPFDRTPFYVQMAGIEQSFRKKTGHTRKIRETIAHMLSDTFAVYPE